MLMTPSQPYLIRAMYQWIVDNGMTPHLLVDTTNDNASVPDKLIKNGKIVLNIGPMAVHGLKLGNEEVTFSARFNGKSMNILVPIESVMAIYTRENGQGMMFSEDDITPPPEPAEKGPRKAQLKLVK